MIWRMAANDKSNSKEKWQIGCVLMIAAFFATCFVGIMVGGGGDSEEDDTPSESNAWIYANCDRYIELSAEYDYRWEGGFAKPKFFVDYHETTSDGYTRYFGDRIEFQNAIGNWVNMRYWCDVDVATGTYKGHRVERGRFRR